MTVPVPPASPSHHAHGLGLLSVVILTIAGGLSSSCGWFRPHVADQFNPHHPRFARVEPSLLDADHVRLVSAHEEKGSGEPLVLLAGENHAQADTQTEVADWLGGLLREPGAIDAVLLEGSEGPLEWSHTAKVVREELGVQGAETFWRGQLEAGEISGLEFAFLTSEATVPLIGIEDVALKDASDQEYLLGDPTQWKELDAEDDSRLRLLRECAGAEVTAPSHQAVEAYANALEHSRTARDLAVTSLPQAVDIEARIRSAVKAYEETVGRYNEKVDAYQASARELRARATRFDKKAQAFNAAVARGRGDPNEYARLEAEQSQLQEMADQLSRDGSAIEALAGTISAKEGEITDLGSQHEALVAAITPYQEAVVASEQAQFVAANAASEACRAVGKDSAPIDLMFTDYARRADKHQDPLESLAKRDDAMVQKARAWWAGREQPVVVMLVGSAHLPSLQDRLENEKVSFVSLSFAAADDPSLDWETRAWGQRLGVTDPGERKERSYFMPGLEPKFYERAVHLARTGKMYVAQMAPDQASLRKTNGAEEWLLRRRPSGEDRPRDWFGVDHVWSGVFLTASGDLVDVLVRDGDAVRASLGEKCDDNAVFIDVSTTDDGYRYAIPDGKGSRPVSAADAASFARDQAADGKNIVVLTALTFDEEATQDIRQELWTASASSGEPPTWWARAQFGSDPERARHNLEVLRRRDEADGRHLVMVIDPVLHSSDPFPINIDASKAKAAPRVHLSEGPGSLTSMAWSPPDGTRTDTLFVVAHNTPELRHQLRLAAANRKLVNKEVVLVICGGEGREIDLLSGELRAGGAASVVVFRQAIDGKEAQQIVDAVAEAAENLNRGTTGADLVREALKSSGMPSTSYERHVLLVLPEIPRPSRG
ncbi:MAG: hypothetical protein ABIO70_05800 [Pseudomonadota bacterium]